MQWISFNRVSTFINREKRFLKIFAGGLLRINNQALSCLSMLFISVFHIAVCAYVCVSILSCDLAKTCATAKVNVNKHRD